jgi:hypothetical protein
MFKDRHKYRSREYWREAGSAAAALGVMYLLDPEQGAQRRALLGQRIGSWARRSGETLAVAGRDVGDRALAMVGRPRHKPARFKRWTLGAGAVMALAGVAVLGWKQLTRVA